jgi:hypothetical protein
VLRIGFGLLWLLDGILQAQPNMPAGLPSQVIEPTAGGVSPMGAARGALGPGHLGEPPLRVWRSPRAGQLILAGLGLFLAMMAGLQAQPSLGYWQGVSSEQPGPLAAMVRSCRRSDAAARLPVRLGRGVRLIR